MTALKQRSGSAKRYIRPLALLIRELDAAAAQIGCAEARRIAAREAERLPLDKVEKVGSRKGEIATLARAEMKRLPALEAVQFGDAVKSLRGFAELLGERPYQASEVTRLGQRPARGLSR